MVYHVYDANGYYVEDIIADECPDNATDMLLPQPCYRPRWDGKKWQEESPPPDDTGQYQYNNGEWVNILPTLQAAKIEESKQLLSTYLQSHPLQSSAHGGKAAHYSVTADKQSLLTSALMMAQGAMQNGIPYTVKWNATGEECEVWQFEELMLLAFEIDAYVTPLISRQQAIEVQINACTSIDELEAVEIDYSTVYGDG